MLSPLPKVIVATTTVTATTAPMRAERTGTAERPCPRSREKRSPATAGAGEPGSGGRVHDARAAFVQVRPARPGAAERLGGTRAATVKTLRPTTRRAKPDPSTVQSKAIPGVGSTSATGPRGAKGESPTAMARATSPPSTTLVSQAERRPPRQDRRFSSEGTKDLYVLAFGPKAPAYREPRHEQGDEASDGPEHPEGDGLRLARPFDLSFCHRGDVEGIDAAFREELDDLSFDGGDVRAAVSEPEPVRRVRRAARAGVL